MFNKDIQNRIDSLFPGLSNKIDSVENANSLDSTDNLWQGVSEKFGNSVKKIIAPLDGVTMDVITDLTTPNPDAAPTVQVEVIKSVGDALVDATDWDQTAVENEYVDVKLHRISRPFKLSVYDLMHGERIESKVAAAAEVVAQGVLAQFYATIAGISPEEISDFGPEAAAEISGAFDTAETNALIVTPSLYSKLIPTSTLGLNPDADGAYGINKIRKSVMPGITAFNAVAMTEGAVAGAIATPAVLQNHGKDIRVIGSIAGFPLVLKSEYDWNENLKCSVECMAGFALTDENRVKTYKA